MSNILHDWPDEQCLEILKNCRRALEAVGDGGRLLILEMIVPEGNEPSVAKLLDLEVLVMGGGRERTLTEFDALLKASGFEMNRIIDVGENDRILECRPA
jgi:hypothetical protein